MQQACKLNDFLFCAEFLLLCGTALRHAGRQWRGPEVAVPLFESLVDASILMAVENDDPACQVVHLRVNANEAANFMKPMPGLVEVWWAAEDALEQAMAGGGFQWQFEDSKLSMKDVPEQQNLADAQKRKRASDALAVKTRTW